MEGNGSNGRNRLVAAAVRFQPDSRLVGLVREGHDLAFEEIVRRYRPQLVSFAGAIVPRDQAEDVVQEALTKAHGALGSEDAEINLRPWLYTIVRNRSLNALRDEPVHDHLDENFDGVPQPPEVAARRAELAAVIASLKGLPAPQREAIVKRELEGRSHDEIASSLGLSAGAVRGLIYRARATLRDGAGMLIPMPFLRALLSSGGADASGAAAAAGLAGGAGGGIALKAGATLGVAVIAVGSGLAIQHRSGKQDDARTLAERGAAHSHASSDGSVGALRSSRGSESARTGSGEGSLGGSGPSGSDRHGSSGSSDGRTSGPGGGSSGEGSGSSGPGGGSSGSGDDGGGSGSGTSDDDGGGSGTSGSGGGDDGGGSSTSGSGSGDGGGGDTSGSGTSGSGSDGGGSSGSDDGSGSSGGGGDLTTTTTTTTTTTSDGGSSGSD